MGFEWRDCARVLSRAGWHTRQRFDPPVTRTFASDPACQNVHPYSAASFKVLDRSVHVSPMLPRFVPQSDFDSIVEPKFVIDGAKVILDNWLCCAHGLCHLAIFEPLGDKFDNSSLILGKGTIPVAFSPIHTLPHIGTERRNLLDGPEVSLGFSI